MLGIHSFFPNLRFSEKTAPIIFLIVLFLAFGLVITSLGIYQDDWVFVYNAYVRGPEGLRAFLNADGTPFSTLMNVALFNLLGVKPLYWHIAALSARWLTVVMFWLVLRQLWPANPFQNFLAGLLFAIYPFFNLQPLAFTFLHIWVAYFFLALSFYWMILSVKHPDKFWLYLILSLVAAIVTELTQEYFMGLEFLRPVILWMVLREQAVDIKSRLRRVIMHWAPYLIIFGIYSWWRFFIYQVPIENRNDPVGLKLFFTDPMAEVLVVLSNIIPDALTIIVAAWYKVFDPLFFDLTDRRNLLFTFLSIFTGLAVFLALNYLESEKSAEEQVNSRWPREAFVLGLIIIVLGLIPPYVGGLFINEKNALWNSRFGLASMLGASMIVIAILEFITPKLQTRLVLIAVLVGLSVGYHARYTNDYRWAWRKELNLYRQLLLRAPDVEPNTAVIADQEILYYMGDYPTAYAINTIYADPLSDNDPYVDYWFFSISSNFASNVDAFMDGMEIDASHRSVSFIGKSDQSLIVSFEPDSNQCLYVIRPQDASFRKLPPLLKEASPLSALDRIHTTAEPSSSFLQTIGVQYPEDWCTYYQKADLARQTKDYEKVVELWKAAGQNNFSPDAYFEYIPFLDAFTALNQWDKAVELTLESARRFPISRPTLCDYWNALPDTAERELAFKKVESKLNCLSSE